MKSPTLKIVVLVGILNLASCGFSQEADYVDSLMRVMQKNDFQILQEQMTPELAERFAATLVSKHLGEYLPLQFERWEIRRISEIHPRQFQADIEVNRQHLRIFFEKGSNKNTILMLTYSN